MKKFKSLNFTYERLKSEVEMLTTKSIKVNGEYNTINTKIKEAKEELIRVEKKIKEEIHISKSEIVNFNKDYKKEIDDKAKKIDDLEQKLKDKRSNLLELDKRLDKRKMELDTTEEELRTLQGELDSKSIRLDREERQIMDSYCNLKKDKAKWEIDIKDKIKISKELGKNIQAIREEEEQSKEDYRIRMQEISQQKKVLILWEEGLKEKEKKIQSDMKTLLSAKQYMKGVNKS